MTEPIPPKWRLIDDNIPKKGIINMAIDESILIIHSKGLTPPTLRFYTWDPIAISIGYNQDINIVNINKCRKYGIDIVKRPTGGRAVFHQGELTYSIVTSDKYGIKGTIFKTYLLLNQALIKGLNFLGIKVDCKDKKNNEYKNSNVCFSICTDADISYLGKKIIGSAQTRKGNNILQHGSILINQDFKKLSELLNLKDSNKLINKAININDILKKEVTIEELKENIKQGFQEVFNIKFEKTELTQEEIITTYELLNK